VSQGSGEDKQLPAGTVHELVTRSAAALPDAVALVGAGMTVTYRELEERSSALARRLQALGVRPESCVGICMARTPEMVVACLAILKAGGVYVPLDPAFPTDRMSFMLSEVGAGIVVVDEPTAVPSGPWRVVQVDDAAEHELETEAGGPEVNPENGCYVIFTSGSTGRPKGTTVTHHNVVRLIHGVRERLSFGPDDVWTLFHSMAFDFSVWEMWGALTTGGRLVVVPYAVSRNVHEFHELVRTERVTILSQTPSAFRQFETADDQAGGELSLRAVVFGGEALHRPSVRRWAARHGYACPLLVNMYGITETTVHVTYHVLTEQDLDRELTQIGRPLPDLTVHVLDPHGRPCPIGVTGEIHVGGAGLSRGYTNRPELTAERFVPDHVTGRPGGLLYRSGDLGRWSAHGGLEYVGRADSQVKIRGYRIETGEIEAALGAHPRLLESAVIACVGNEGQTDLAGYLVPDGVAPSTDELRAWLRKRLPDYMVPRHFMVLDALPLTPQGKVDRKALPEPEAVRPELAQEYGAPVGAVEQLLADIWCQVLELDRVGRHDNFFDLGGDSIRSIQVLGVARDAGVTLRLHDIVDAPTVAGLAATVTRSTPAEPPAAAQVSRPFSLVPENERSLLLDGLVDAYPMAELQIGMIYEMERDRARNAYHNVETLRVAGRFDEACFREAVDRTVARHPVLRTSFDLTRFSEPMQLVHDTVDVPLAVADLRQASADEGGATLRNYLRIQQDTRFDLSTAPLFRMAVHVVSDEAFLWTITEHHAILDGWSMVSTVSEIADLYRRLLAGERPATRPLRSLYRDFVAAERAALRSSQSREFWRDRLAAQPAGCIPRWSADDPEEAAALAGEKVDGERHDRDEAAGHGVLATPLSADLLHELEDFASRAGVPLKTALLAAQLKAVSLLAGSADVLIGMTANGRLEEADAAEVRGLFLNTVPLRVRLPEGSWQALARAVFRAERDLLPHRRYPMAALQREFGGEEPLFGINFAYNNFHPIARLAADGRLYAGADVALPGVARTNFALDMTFSHDPAGGLLLEIGYALRDLAADQVTRLRDSLLRALSAMGRHDQAHHHASSLMGTGEERVLTAWQGTDAPVSGVPVHELFRERAASWPDAVAVEFGADRLTFAELDARSEALARRLVAAGAGRGDAVGLHLRPGVDAVVAVWAAWKAGGAFLPLDPDLPPDRLEKMLEDAVPTVLVSCNGSGVVGSWTTVSPDPDAAVPDVALPRVGPRDLAYTMFTSGSTGRPKGIMVEHGNLTNYAVGLMLPRLRQAGIGASGRVLTGTSAFLSDFFLAQLLPLLDGHCLTVLAGADRRDPRLLVELAQDPNRAVDIIDATASQVQLMVEAGLLDAPHPPRLITSSGETCPPDVWGALRSRPHVTAHNAYGPAEVAVDATYADIGAHESPVIGRPYGNVRVYLVDDALQLVPPGTAGELVIGGPGVSRGYLGQPAATAAAFVPDPWGEPGSRLYRSGDLGRYTSDGQIEFLGRNDHQVKILGQRVEPEDVEAAWCGQAPAAGRAPGDGRWRGAGPRRGPRVPGRRASKRGNSDCVRGSRRVADAGRRQA
jgi:amino acid adenylation domain-containing protein